MSSHNLPAAAARVISYVDGFNLYFGLRASGLHSYRWLDVEALTQYLLKNDQTLVRVKYFTALISPGPSKKHLRQGVYLDALRTRANTEIILGRYMRKDAQCRECGHKWQTWEEKMTDVNIAAHLTNDAYAGRMDTALVISGDSDLARAIELVRATTGVRVVAVFPPMRASVDLREVVDASFSLNRGYIMKSLLEDPVMSGTRRLRRPTEWR